MSKHQVFELRRLSDDLVYVFDRREIDGGVAYQRRDQDLWVVYKGTPIGWCAFDEEDQDIRGRPWSISFYEQSEDYPPEGEWVSKKGVKSYVYDLKYI